MLGSILSNILLVLGCSCFFGGLKHHEGIFQVTAAQTYVPSSLVFHFRKHLIIAPPIYRSSSVCQLRFIRVYGSPTASGAAHGAFLH
jgi:Ca2+/H+ antiporter